MTIPRQSDAVMNLGHFLTQAARRRSDQPALIRGDAIRTWAEMNARVDAIAHALCDLGVGKGDRVVLHSDNCLEMAEAMYAVFKTGAVLTPTNFRLAAGEVAGLAESAGATAMIGNAAFPDHIAAVEAAGAGDWRGTIAIGGDYETLVAANAGRGAFREAEVVYNDPAWFFFTSGTTGRPKGAVLSHGQLAFVIVNHVADLMPGLGRDDVSLVVAPLSHGAGLHFFIQVARAVPSILLSGSSLAANEVWDLVQRHRVTNMFTVPTIVKRLVEDPAVDRFDHSSLRHVIYAGAPMYRADQRLALEKLGPVLVQYFGLGEVTGAITVLPPEDHHLDDAAMKLGTCGYPRTGLEVAILDKDGNDLGAGATGDICVRGLAVMAGYYRNDKANQDSFRKGWFVTGDIGHLDEDNYLYITGRASDMYISGGSNIYPREIEEKLLNHPDIEEVAIVGVPDPDWGRGGSGRDRAPVRLGFRRGRFPGLRRRCAAALQTAPPRRVLGRIAQVGLWQGGKEDRARAVEGPGDRSRDPMTESPLRPLLVHPGAVVKPRVTARAADEAIHARARLPAGMSLQDAVEDVTRSLGSASGTATLFGGAFSSMRFTTGGPDRHGTTRAANYTWIRDWGAADLISGEISLGAGREGGLFIHCHATFVPDPAGIPDGEAPEADMTGGHLFVPECMISRPILAQFTLFNGFRLAQTDDDETHHSIFEIAEDADHA